MLCDVAHSAMVESKDDFVQMLLDNGLELSQLVSGDSPNSSDGLIQLYQKVPVYTQFRMTFSVISGC